MHVKNKSKIAVIGCGNVGSAIAYHLVSHAMADEIVLIDKNHQRAMGDAIDMAHAKRSKMNLYAGEYAHIAGSDLIIISVGVARKNGQTRMDLLQANYAIAHDVAQNVKKHYTTGVVLVVFNPVDVMTYCMAEWLDLPYGTVIGSGTTLDMHRLNTEISDYFDVNVANVSACVIGEHGDGNVPIWSLTSVCGMNIDLFCKTHDYDFTSETKSQLTDSVKKAGTNVIAKKGFTCYGIAAAVADIAHAVLHDANTIIPVCLPLQNVYGVEETAVSVLCVIGKNGAKKVLQPSLTKEELNNFVECATRVKTAINQCL